ncbi:hypothetical protein [Klebsiella pneumoniae]|uniref:hypothetical protein n=1 Tax=Klebsiella pneumoniae TaxID=573 RepID=UPI00402BA40E
MKNDGHYFCRAGGNRPDGLNEPVTGIRHEGLYIICSLCVFYFFCLEVEISDGEFSANLLFLIVFFHVVLLFITLLICLWQGAMLLDAIFMGQIIASMCLLFFIPVLSIIRRSF